MDQLGQTGSEPKIASSISRELAQTEKEIAKTEKAMSELVAEYEKLQSFKGVGSAATQQETNDKIANLDIKLMETGETLDSLHVKSSKLQEKLQELKLNPRSSDEGKKLQEDLTLATEKLKRLEDEASVTKEQLNQLQVNPNVERMPERGRRAMNNLKKSTRNANKELRNTNSLTGKIAGGFSSLLKRIGRMTLAVGVFNVIRKALRALVQYLGSALMANEQFAASLGQIKGNLATAFQPIFDAIMPALNVLMAALSKITGYIAALVNLIFGKSLGASQQSAKALNDQAKGYGAVGKAAKKASGELAAFDELNVLSRKDEDDGGAGGGAGAPTFDLDPTTLPLLESLKDKLKKFWDMLEPTRAALGRLGEELKRLGEFSWQALKDFYHEFLVPVGTWVLGEGLPRFIDAVTNELATIDWAKINNSLIGLWQALAPFAIHVGEGLLWFWENVLVKFAGFVVRDALPKFLDMIAEAVKVLDAILLAAAPIFLGFWEGFLQPFGEWTGSIVLDALELVTSLLKDLGDWIRNNQSNFEELGAKIELVTGKLWELIKPMLNTVWNTLKEIIIKIKDAFISLLTHVLPVIDAFLNLINAFIEWSKQSEFMKSLIDLLSTAWDALKVVVMTAIDAISISINGFWDILKNLLDFFTKLFQGDIEGALESLKKAFGSFGTTVLGLMANVANGIVDVFEKAINWVIRQLNKISFDIPDWVPKIGGKSFGISISEVSLPHIPVPKLATGAVIPPNSEFMAILGDQKKGTNIETPEGLLREIFQEELSNLGRGETELTLNFTGDLAALARVLNPYLEQDGKRKGVKLVTGGALV